MNKADCRKNNLATGNVQDWRMKERKKKFAITQETDIKSIKKHGSGRRNEEDKNFGYNRE